MTKAQIIRSIRDRLLKRLEEKTSWGRNEAKKMIDDVISETMLDLLDED